MKLTLDSGRVVSCASGASVREIAERESLAGADRALAAWIDDRLVDLSYRVEADCRLRLVDFSSEEGQEIYRHSVSHLMAQAVKHLFPQARLAIGPAIADGFYYDFQVENPFVPEDLTRIEEEMVRIAGEDLAVVRMEMSRDEARDLFRQQGEQFKVELLDEMEDERVSLYRQGDFLDLCRGPHVPSTGSLSNFKLLNAAGSYWRGDENRDALQRIYGTAWGSPAELESYLERLEQARERDHRRLGPALDLFSIHEEAGGGLAHWHPKGMVVRTVIEEFWKREHEARGYQFVSTPHLGRARMWRQSGHFDYYRENLYVVHDDLHHEDYVVKPMNCLGHIHIYQTRLRSYRELPLRLAELGTVYRREMGGVLHGLFRVRGFTQDDAHIFCTRETLAAEIKGVVELALYMLRSFGFSEFEMELSQSDPNRPQDYAGERTGWEWAEGVLARVLDEMDLPFTRNEGEAAFYGPKIDIHLLDALGRRWQGPTIQLDFNLPERFNVNYVGADGSKHHVLMVHRTVLGSIERFIGILIEHYAGTFPLWLAPVQALVLPVSRDQREYGEEIVRRMKEVGLRGEIDRSDEKIGQKIRRAEMSRSPLMLIVGRREAEAGTASVRRRGVGDEGPQELSTLIEEMQAEVRNRGPSADSPSPQRSGGRGR